MEEVETARHGPDRPGIRVQRDEGTGDVGNLSQSIVGAFFVRPGLQPNQIPDRKHVGHGLRFRPAAIGRAVGAGPVHGGQPETELLLFSLRQQGGLIGLNGENDGRHQPTDPVGIVQPFAQLIGSIEPFTPVSLRPAVAVTTIVVDQRLAQTLVSRSLGRRVDGRVDRKPHAIGLLAVLLDQVPPRHLGGVGGAGRHGARGVEFAGKLLGHGPLEGGLIDLAELEHATQDVSSPRQGPLGVAHRVGGRGGLGQGRQHRRLGDGELREVLVEVHLRGRLDPVGPVAHEDLVEIQGENLLLAESTIDLDRQQDLVELAGVGLLAPEIEIPRHLHGDR